MRKKLSILLSMALCVAETCCMQVTQEHMQALAVTRQEQIKRMGKEGDPLFAIDQRERTLELAQLIGSLDTKTKFLGALSLYFGMSFALDVAQIIVSGSTLATLPTNHNGTLPLCNRTCWQFGCCTRGCIGPVCMELCHTICPPESSATVNSLGIALATTSLSNLALAFLCTNGAVTSWTSKKAALTALNQLGKAQPLPPLDPKSNTTTQEVELQHMHDKRAHILEMIQKNGSYQTHRTYSFLFLAGLAAHIIKDIGIEIAYKNDTAPTTNILRYIIAGSALARVWGMMPLVFNMEMAFKKNNATLHDITTYLSELDQLLGQTNDSD